MKSPMKLIHTALITTLILFFACGNKVNKGLVVVAKTYSFDTIAPSKEFVSIYHHIINKTDKPWKPDTIFSNCECLSSFYKREEIKPGDTLTIMTHLYSAYEEGAFNKTITVKTGLKGADAEIRLLVTGFIDASLLPADKRFTSQVGDLWFKSTAFDFGTLTQGQIGSTGGQVYNAGEEPITFIGIAYLPQFIQFDFFPRTIQPGEVAEIKALYNAKLNPEIGRIKLTMKFLTDKDSTNGVIVNVLADVKEDFSTLTAEERKNVPQLFAADTFYTYGEIKEGEVIKHEFTIENRGARELIIHKIESGCGCTAVAAGKRVLAPGEKVNINATFNSRNKTGNSRIYIRVVTNDPNKPYQYLVLDGEVK